MRVTKIVTRHSREEPHTVKRPLGRRPDVLDAANGKVDCEGAEVDVQQCPGIIPIKDARMYWRSETRVTL